MSIGEWIERGEQRINRYWVHRQNNRQITWLAQRVRQHAPLYLGTAPVVFFNASTRLSGLSLNAAFALLSSWGLSLAGVPVVNFVCEMGMSRCVLGTNRKDPHRLPPCRECIKQSDAIYAFSDARRFQYQLDPSVESALAEMNLEALMETEIEGLPLGKLVLPSVRWALRSYHLAANEPTLFLYRQYLLSAWWLAQEFGRLLDEVQPQAVVVFNGVSYPEATARWVAEQHSLRVITHEVCHLPLTAFFVKGDATAYPIDVPPDFKLSPVQEKRLDAYLEQRFKGNFSMAGVRFWPEMQNLSADFLQRAGQFKQIVPVFTNVIFDTSQSHSNVVFEQMFAWLEQVLEIIQAHPETFFVIRAHPDETRPGKESQENVADWVKRNRVDDLPNVLFVDSRQYFSSYELIQRSKFVMVYNSTIGLEATLLGAAVLCGGKARFTQLPIVFFPQTPQDHRRQAEEFLAAGQVQVPAEFTNNARRFIYLNLYRACLPFGDLLENDGVWPGYVSLKDFDYDALQPGYSPTMKVIVNGIVNDRPFLMDEKPS